MVRKVWSHVRPLVFWSYRRGSLQYDVIVILILAFIFLIPRNAFNDRPSEAVVQEVAAPSDETRVFWIDPGALDRANPEGAQANLQHLLRSTAGPSMTIVRTEAAKDSAGNVRGFLVHARP